MVDRRDQFWAFIALLFVIGTLGIAPVGYALFWGKALPPETLATVDKTVSSLGGVLGSVGTLLFGGRVLAHRARQRRAKAASK
ncbi:hypothetical protein HZY97_16290 [Sphingomonas sp. R-74633]|uniref:hypothetical protein n=1 Tax=Sphingomonas sp. R-74633 TaxID=2751188 RepID=UPI0015D3781C|nr:hypothetical protein [Sphingomonas sp. R-74633]NYT42333.1 hypothetical protein [Sphingomonas sp. R-74633]